MASKLKCVCPAFACLRGQTEPPTRKSRTGRQLVGAPLVCASADFNINIASIETLTYVHIAQEKLCQICFERDPNWSKNLTGSGPRAEVSVIQLWFILVYEHKCISTSYEYGLSGSM